MNKLKSIVFIVCSFFLLADGLVAQTRDKVLAEVNGVELTYGYLLDQFPEEYQSSLTPVQISNAVETWIETELLYQKAINDDFQNKEYIKNQIEQKKKELIALSYVEQSLAETIELSDEEIDSAYNANKQRFVASEDLFHLNHIVLPSKASAEAVITRLNNGDDFGSLAIDYSEDEDSRHNGGDIGLVPLSAFEPSMAESLQKLEKGGFSAPLQSQSNFFHIFKLQNKYVAGTVLPLDQIRSDVAQSLFAEKQQIMYEDYIQGLLESARIQRYN